MKQLKLLGFITSEYSAKPELEKATGIVNMPTPRNVREVRFLGESVFFRRHIATTPLTRKDKGFSLGRRSSKVF